MDQSIVKFFEWLRGTATATTTEENVSK